MIRSLPLAIGGLVLAGVAVSQAPPPQPARGGPPPGFAQSTYTEVCAGCHGTGLEGGRGPALFNPTLQAARTDAQWHATIRNGVAGTEMPPFKDVYTDDQIWQLVTFLRARGGDLQPKPAAVVNPDGQVVRSQKQAFRIETVADGLVTPWALAFLPDGRLLVTERPGRLRIIDKSGRLLPDPVKGTPAVLPVQDGGMFDIALHPDYARNGWIYMSFSERLAGSPDQPPRPDGRPTFPLSMTVIARGKINARGEWTDQQILYRAPAALYTSSGSHYGSRFLFDRKGHVFYSIGERGNVANAQNLASPLGKIHRINEDGSVPADNPFVGRADAVPTIWSYGHRNPEGLAFEPGTGTFWESEHGPVGGDEINVIVKGGNYGWGVATMGLQAGINQRSAPGMIDPVAHYTPTIAPSGIAFYTGNRYPGWKGNLFVAALAGQQLRRLEVKDGKVIAQEPVIQQFGRVRATATGPDGLIYVLLQDPTGGNTGKLLSDPTPGRVVRLVPVQ